MDERDKLLQRARQSVHGWRLDDLDALYLSFGFEYKEGGSHRIYFHPAHPDLVAPVPRHRDVKAVYVRLAIRLIAKLREIENRK